MKAISLLIAASISLIIGISEHGLASLTNTHRDRGGFAVVELFTSEGCSSCPPADEAVIELANDYKQDVYVLGFHVDYWNQLGWKDSFSNAAYSKRQQQYGSLLGLTSIYTPQVIVNGRTEFVGSDKRKLRLSVEEALNTSHGANIMLKANVENNNIVGINYSLPKISDNILNVALIERQAESEVKTGENTGKKLRHINLVRAFSSIPLTNKEGTVSFTLPGGLAAKDCKVIAYVQNRKNWRVEGATAADIVSN